MSPLIRRTIAAMAAVVSGACTTTSPTPEWQRWSESERAEVHTQLGINYLGQGQFEIARRELDLALDIAPRYSRANHAMATLHAALGETEPAGRYYQRAVRYDEGNFLARNDYGRFLCERDRVEDGIEQFRKAMDNPLNRQLQQSTYGAAACLIRAARTAEARELLARTLRIEPNMKPALYQMAVISHDDGDHLSARGYLERFFDGGTATAAALLLAVRNELKLGAGDLVDVYAKQLRTQFPRSPELARLRELLNDHS